MRGLLKRKIKTFRLVIAGIALSLFSLSAIADDGLKNEEVIVKSRPDVVLEMLSMLTPKTTQAALDAFPVKLFTDMGAKSLVNASDGVTIDYEDPYEPYVNPEHEAHKITALYKMENDTEGGSILPLIKSFGFEQALFFANKLFWYLCVFFVSLAAGRMAWVSMTIEDENKAYKKLIALIPVLAISLFLVKPVAEGYTYAQLILVWAFIASNYLASLVSMLGSIELYKHVYNSYVELDDEEPIKGTVSMNVPNLFDNIANQSLSTLMAEQSMESTVNTMLEGDELNSANLSKAIDRYNKDNNLDGKYAVTAACFGSNWASELANNLSCAALKADKELPIKNLVFKTPISRGIKDFGATSEKYEHQIKEVADKTYTYIKDSYCSKLARSKFGFSKSNADRSFICKMRDSNGGFTSDQRYHGFELSSSSMLTPITPELDVKNISETLFDVTYAMMKDSIKELPDNKLDTTFYNRGFFISPLESVYVAIKQIGNKKEMMSKRVLKKASATTETKLFSLLSKVIPVEVDPAMRAHLANNRVNSPHIPHGALATVDFSEFGGQSASAIDTFGLWKELTASIVFTKHIGEDTTGASKNDQVVMSIFEDNKLKTIEPYSKLSTVYYSLLPLSVAAYAGGKMLSGREDVEKVSVNRFAAGSLLKSLGVLMFFTSMACKVIGGLLFLSFAILLLIKSFKRLIVSLISAQVVAVKFLKDGFDETRDDDDNLIVSKYLINATVRIFIDLPMIFIAILCAYIIGTFSANLIAFMFVVFGSTSMSLTQLNAGSIAGSIFFFIGLFGCIIWGLYQGMQLMSYVHKKATDFVDDATGVASEQTQDDLMMMIRSTLMPTRYIK